MPSPKQMNRTRQNSAGAERLRINDFTRLKQADKSKLPASAQLGKSEDAATLGTYCQCQCGSHRAGMTDASPENPRPQTSAARPQSPLKVLAQGPEMRYRTGGLRILIYESLQK